MDIFIIREGRQAGPYSEDAVKAFLTDGTVRPTDMGWRKGLADWRALSEVLKLQSEQPGDSATPPPTAPGSNGTSDNHIPATAKQKAFLKYLGAEFGENLTKERAALAVSDALETPKFQTRIRKWHDEKLRQHPDVFQDEIDFRRANRSNRYLERIQTEGSEVVKDVTKAHVQVLVESLDKRHPGWESDRDSALWDYLLPSVGEHFPQLVLPTHKDRVKASGMSRIGGAATRSMRAAGLTPPPAPPSTLGAMMRGVALGVIALGAIVFGRQYWQQSHEKGAAPVSTSPAPSTSGKSEAPPATNEPASKAPVAPSPEKLLAEAKAPDAAPENPPPPVAPEPVSAPAPASVAPAEPPASAPPAMNAEKPAAPATPEEKPAAPVPMTTPAAPTEPAVTPPAAPPQRTAVKLIQGIGVMLSNGQVTLPAGTPLRYLGTEGPNVRVSWNNNVFFVPAMATDVNEPLPATTEPAATPPAPGNPPAAPAAPQTPGAAKPKKPTDDL